MLVGVPKEIKPSEFRVGLTPEAVREYCAAGHQVIVETNAGEGICKSDDVYRASGAEIVDTAAEVFERADMIVKVKEPQPSEWVQLREGQILYTYLHLAPDPEQARGLMNSGVSAVAYETVTGPGGGLPLLAPMSEVAGRLSIEAAGQALKAHNGGRGVLMGGVPGVLPAKVVILGGGVVGTQAARMAVGLGANVEIFDKSLHRIRQLDDMFQGRVTTRYSTMSTIEDAIGQADVVVGAVLIPGASAPNLVTRDMLKLMVPRAVLVDVAIDQGGCFETSHPTTHQEPTYEVEGVIHYCVANMPGAVPLTSSYALNNATLPYGLALANRGITACEEDPHLMNGLNVHQGKIVNAAVKESLGF
ncbi:Alanine dehydrogenase [Altererythrobacter epoxidivorans]|uniref:Alanine dehydrogenase n=1 Tax=Altererythrobacter epoxidivorans TaxID=361183 RepID=A0A0M4LTJ9_9SPHN|nr:alanine dehydrogenase [Altererythrobacter epoxidivorans]ALE16104.1 Alanine dehydrogenase [Altererythrobacter epoxidivorans]